VKTGRTRKIPSIRIAMEVLRAAMVRF
jgi:hypothetical protein